MLQGKKILLGVTGGIAAYKAPELLRRLQDAGAEVRVACTPDSQRFIGQETLSALSHFPVYSDESGAGGSGAFRHIDYPRWADLVLVAPCTANTLARIVAGLAEEPVSLCCLAASCPVALVPAMNQAMYQAPATQENLATAGRRGMHIMPAATGYLACGEEGPGRFPEIAALVDWVDSLLSPLVSRGRVLLTAGRTEEPIDPVRYISNRSSGKTAMAIALALRDAGFAVDLVHGPMDAKAPTGVTCHPVQTSREMHAASMQLSRGAAACVLCAAVADYRPANIASEKIKDSRSLLQLELVPNPNILRDLVAQKSTGQVIVGFALETTDAVEHGKAKLSKSGADFLVLNTPVRSDSGFGKDEVEYCILTPETADASLQLKSKRQLANDLVQQILVRLENA